MEFCGTAFSSRILDRVQHLVRAFAELNVILTLYFEDALLVMIRVTCSTDENMGRYMQVCWC
jgi:hypothetical protein